MRRILIIFLKELKDMLRDRRTIFMMIVFPLILMFTIINIMVTLQMSQAKKAEQKTLKVALITDGNAQAFRTALKERSDMKIDETVQRDQVESLIKSGKLDFAIVFSKDFDQMVNEKKTGEVEVLLKTSRENDIAKKRIIEMLEQYKKDILSARLTQLNLESSFIEPVNITERNMASMKEVVGEAVGGMLPYMFIIFCFLGAMTPAVDLAAGEKERLTIETLLTSPASRLQIVLGKFLVVVLAGMTRAVVSIVGLYVSLKGVKGIPDKAFEMFLRLVEGKSVALLLSLLLPLCIFMAALLLSLSIYAKSYKEAQSIVGPLNIVFILPALIGLVPGIKLSFATALIPVLNVSLAAKEVVSGTIKTGLLIEVFASMIILAGISLWFCSEWFKREDVIFRGI